MGKQLEDDEEKQDKDIYFVSSFL